MRNKDLLRSGKLNLIECSVRKFDKYQVVVSKEPDPEPEDTPFYPTYIIGITNESSNDGNDITVGYTDGKLLLNLLDLYENLEHQMENANGAKQSITPESITETVVQWTEDNGLLFLDEEVSQKYNSHGIRVDKFYGMLELLWIAYEYYQRITMSKLFLFGQDREYDIDVARYNLQLYFNKFFRVQLNVELSDNQLHVKYCADDMLSAAYTQLFFNVLSQESGVIDVCRNCGKPYLKTRSNRQYCSDCQKNKYQISRDRKRKREKKQDS